MYKKIIKIFEGACDCCCSGCQKTETKDATTTKNVFLVDRLTVNHGGQHAKGDITQTGPTALDSGSIEVGQAAGKDIKN